MVVWHALKQRPHEFILLVSIRLHRWCEPIRHQGLKSTILLPGLKAAGILQDLEKKRLVVAFEKDALMATAAFDQQIDGLPGRRSSIDIIAHKYMQCSRRAGVGQVMVDRGEHIQKQIRTSVNVADRIDADAVG